ncbi:2-dehydropantoate 2-reductase N-terminal domain-containing protein [soil metagenome]
MRWIVYGAGAVGGVLGGRLHEAGEDVVLVARGNHLDVVRRDGLTLATPEGTRTIDVPAAADAREAAAGADEVTVLLVVKSHQTHAAIEDLTSALPSSTPVVSVQNGVANEPTLLRFFDDVQGVCVMMPTGHLEPGVVQQHCSPVPGILDVGRFPSGTDATSEAVAAAFGRAGFVSEPRADVMAWKHRKLMMNLGNAVQACCAPGPDADTLRRRATDEGEAVLAAGIPVIVVEEDRERRGDILQVAPIAGHECSGGSSWQSLRRGTGSIETDHLNGEGVRLGREHGVPTPVSALLQRTARRMAVDGSAPGTLDAAGLLDQLTQST